MSNDTANRRCITPIARLSFPALFKPAKPMSEGQEGKYQCELIFPKDTDLSELQRCVDQAIEDKWGNKPPAKLRLPFRDGSERNSDGYENSIFFSCRTSDKPGVVIGPNREPCLDPSEVYGGCYVRVSVTAFGYDMTTNKGVAFALNNVWKIRDGESFTGRRSAEAEFADVEMDADAFGAEADEGMSDLI